MAKRRRTPEQIASAADKPCGRCDKVKPLSEFGVNRLMRDGLNCYCRECVRLNSRERDARNRDKEHAQPPAARRCSSCKREKPASAFGKNKSSRDGLHWYCLECARALNKVINDRYREADGGERNRAKAARYREANRNKTATATDTWRKANPDKYRAQRARIARRKRDNGPLFRMMGNIRNRVSRVLKGKRGQRTFDLLGWIPEALRNHVEALLQPGMTWENYGQDWVLDHERPVAAFDFTNNPDALRACWALDNMRPLWKRDNHLKAGLWNGEHWTNGQPGRYRTGKDQPNASS